MIGFLFSLVWMAALTATVVLLALVAITVIAWVRE